MASADIEVEHVSLRGSYDDEDLAAPIPVQRTDARPPQSSLPPERQLANAKASMMSKRTLQWTSTKTPATSVGQALEQGVRPASVVQTGMAVTKVTGRGQMRHRVITVSHDKFALFCTHHRIKEKHRLQHKLGAPLPSWLKSKKGLRSRLQPGKTARDLFVRYIDVADIDDIQVGVVGTQSLEKSRSNDRLKTGADSKVDKLRDQIVTICHHGDETLDLLIPDAQQRKDLISCLTDMCRVYDEAKRGVGKEALLLRYLWYDVDTDRDGLIGENEFVKILSRINFYLKQPGKYYRNFCKERAKRNGLNYPEVMTLLQRLKNHNTRSMANQLWDEIFGEDNDVVDSKKFLKFLHNQQGETGASMTDVEVLFTLLNSMELNHQEGEPSKIVFDQQISRARFEIYLNDEMNDAYDPFAQEMDGEIALDKPMSQFWINTSHNTYLVGDQLRSSSSVEMYLRALRRGCKCLELDCWDGETTKSGQCLPVVYHGHTLTSKILFQDIVTAVKSYMDAHPDTYPIILSLENHCSHPFQHAMSTIMKETLGEYLYRPTALDTAGHLPSPEKLRGKVVIKGKRPPEPDEQSPGVAQAETGEAFEHDESQGGDDYDPYEDVSSPSSSAASASKKPKVVKELAELTLFHGTKYKAFEKSIDEPRSHMHSISESKITKILQKKVTNAELWRQYNVDHMTRTYPAGARVDSSNYNPTLAWSVGSQLVALNFQTTDTPLVLNDGRFRQNHSAGYILKPPSVMGFEHGNRTAAQSEVPLVEYEPDALDYVMEGAEQVICGHEPTRAITHAYPYNRANTNAVIERMTSSTVANKKSGNGTTAGLGFLYQVDLVRPKRLKIRVLSGSCLPKPKGAKTGETIDPYVTITLHDIKNSDDGRSPTYVSSSHSTSVVSDNGFCPVFAPASEKTYMEFIVMSPNVAMVQFSLKESDFDLDDKVGDAAIPLNCLRRGYRSIQFYDKNNTRTGVFDFATVLVEIQFADM